MNETDETWDYESLLKDLESSEPVVNLNQKSEMPRDFNDPFHWIYDPDEGRWRRKWFSEYDTEFLGALSMEDTQLLSDSLDAVEAEERARWAEQRSQQQAQWEQEMASYEEQVIPAAPKAKSTLVDNTQPGVPLLRHKPGFMTWAMALIKLILGVCTMVAAFLPLTRDDLTFSPMEQSLGRKLIFSVGLAWTLHGLYELRQAMVLSHCRPEQFESKLKLLHVLCWTIPTALLMVMCFPYILEGLKAPAGHDHMLFFFYGYLAISVFLLDTMCQLVAWDKKFRWAWLGIVMVYQLGIFIGTAIGGSLLTRETGFQAILFHYPLMAPLLVTAYLAWILSAADYDFIADLRQIGPYAFTNGDADDPYWERKFYHHDEKVKKNLIKADESYSTYVSAERNHALTKLLRHQKAVRHWILKIFLGSKADMDPPLTDRYGRRHHCNWPILFAGVISFIFMPLMLQVLLQNAGERFSFSAAIEFMVGCVFYSLVCLPLQYNYIGHRSYTWLLLGLRSFWGLLLYCVYLGSHPCFGWSSLLVFILFEVLGATGLGAFYLLKGPLYVLSSFFSISPAERREMDQYEDQRYRQDMKEYDRDKAMWAEQERREQEDYDWRYR